MAKTQNTFAKRQREIEKKAKAEAKRERRNQRKLELANNSNPPENIQDVEGESLETDPTDQPDGT